MWKAHVDGAARGNPGFAGIGVCIEDENGSTVKEIGEPLGKTTNNVAEYSALIRALEEARALGCNALAVYTDSELMAHQLNANTPSKPLIFCRCISGQNRCWLSFQRQPSPTFGVNSTNAPTLSRTSART